MVLADLVVQTVLIVQEVLVLLVMSLLYQIQKESKINQKNINTLKERKNRRNGEVIKNQGFMKTN